MHDAITVGVPVLAILLGILLNQRGLERLDLRIDKLDMRIDKLDAKMESRFVHMEGRIDRIQADMAQFYLILGEHGAKIENMQKG
jgi:hypothetical protein